LGSQSSDCVWLPPPATRSATTGSLTPVAFISAPLTPMRTTRLCVQLVWTVLQRSRSSAHGSPFSSTCATLIGPERASLALNARWTVPKLPLHLLPPEVEQVLPFSVPLVSAQLSVTGSGPAFGATGIVVGDVHLPAEYVSV
jgi:hypothetical protein